MKPDFSIVIPAYNEAEGLGALKGAIEHYSAASRMKLQFIFVDDGSSDDTFDTLSAWAFDGAMVKVVKLSRNYGSHAAIRAGVYHADADAVMVYSSDMPEPIGDADLFYEKLQDGYELVYSVRTGYKGDFGSRVFSKLVNRCIDENYPAEGLIGIAFGRKIKEELNSNIELNSSIFFQVFSLGFNRVGIEVPYLQREQGESKWTLGKKLKLFVDSFVMFSFVPIRVISTIGILMSVVGVLWALGIVLAKLFNLFDFASGWPTLFSIVLLGFGLTNISLGIIAEYLVRTLDAARNRKAFIVDVVVDSEDSVITSH